MNVKIRVGGNMVDSKLLKPTGCGNLLKMGGEEEGAF